MAKIRLFDAFTGYGGASWGLLLANIPFEVVGYSEIDKYAIALYELNHKVFSPKNYGDITKINPQDLPDFDFFTGGFPCQSFSQAGMRKGELDPRGTLFYDIIRICEVKKPKYILLENVKGLMTKKHKPTFNKIISELKRLGYNVQWHILNSKDYGVPQNRERVWIFATLKEIPFGWTFIPSKQPLKFSLKDLLEKKVDKKYYLNDTQIKRLNEKTKLTFEVIEPSCFDVYNKKIKEDGTCITITEPHHNTLRLIERSNIIRKFTPREHFRLMGFLNDEIGLDGLSDSQLCKCAGNGWDVNLVSKIMNKISELF